MVPLRVKTYVLGETLESSSTPITRATVSRGEGQARPGQARQGKAGPDGCRRLVIDKNLFSAYADDATELEDRFLLLRATEKIIFLLIKHDANRLNSFHNPKRHVHFEIAAPRPFPPTIPRGNTQICDVIPSYQPAIACTRVHACT